MENERCPKCRNNAASDRTNRWCSECRNAYMRQYRATEERRARDRGFAEGVEAARVLLYQEWSYMRETPVRASEVAEMIRRRLERP